MAATIREACADRGIAVVDFHQAGVDYARNHPGATFINTPKPASPFVHEITETGVAVARETFRQFLNLR